MEKFQVYNRELNTWEDENIELISGWNENFVVDKTTDTAKVKLKYKGTTAPNWNNGDWCRILHLENGEIGATYTSRTETIKEENVCYDIEKTFHIEYDESIGTRGGFNIKFDKQFNIILNNIGFSFSAIAENSLGTQLIITVVYNSDEIDLSQTTEMQIEIPEIIEQGDDNWAIRYPYADYNIIDRFDGFRKSDAKIVNPSTYVGDYEYTKTVYIPKNHEQFIIQNPIMVVDKINEEIDIQLSLGEPIEITNGIIGETRSWTNQSDKTIDGVSYKHEALNHYNVLQRFLLTTPANNDYYKSWLSRITVCDKSLLENTSFTDDSFNEPSLYGILMNKYDSSVGRTPVLYFDIDGETDLPQNNERAEYFLQFERQDGFNKPDIELSDITANCTQTIINKSFENKADGIVSNISNLAPNKSATYVSEYLWAIPEVDTNDRQLPYNVYGDATKNIGVWILKTPHKIKDIKSISRLQAESYTDNNFFKRTTQELTNIYEENVYKANANYNTRNAIWFKQGTNIIHLNDFYSANGRIDIYRVEYEPLIECRYDTGKDYQVQVNQIDGQVAEDRYSKYIKDYLDSMNKVDLEIQKTVENYTDIKEVGSRVVDGNKIYLITSVGISKRQYDYDVVYQLNENHIRRNDVIVAPQNIRKDIAIDYSSITDRRSCLIKNFRISTKRDDKFENPTGFDSLNNKTILSALLQENGLHKPQLALLTFESYLKRQDNTIEKKTIKRLCDGAKSVIDNTICFNLIYENNAECGKKKTLDTMLLSPLRTSPIEQTPILYTDGFGESQYLKISLIEIFGETLQNCTFELDTQQALIEVDRTNFVTDNMTTYPLITDETDYQSICAINNIAYFKDMLEKFNYTLGFKVNEDENMFLCKNFFLNSAMMGGTTQIGYISVHNHNLTESDLINESESKVIVTSSMNADQDTITITANSQLEKKKSLVLWDANNQPLMIINDADKSGNNVWNGQILKLYC